MRKRNLRLSAQLGMTLHELIVVIAIVSILAGVAVGGMGDMLAKRDVDILQENIAQSLRYARTIASSKGVMATVSIDPAAKLVSVSASDSVKAIQSYPISSRISLTGLTSVTFSPFGVPTVIGVKIIKISAPKFNVITRSLEVMPGGQIAFKE